MAPKRNQRSAEAVTSIPVAVRGDTLRLPVPVNTEYRIVRALPLQIDLDPGTGANPTLISFKLDDVADFAALGAVFGMYKVDMLELLVLNSSTQCALVSAHEYDGDIPSTAAEIYAYQTAVGFAAQNLTVQPHRRCLKPRAKVGDALVQSPWFPTSANTEPHFGFVLGFTTGTTTVCTAVLRAAITFKMAE